MYKERLRVIPTILFILLNKLITFTMYIRTQTDNIIVTIKIKK